MIMSIASFTGETLVEIGSLKIAPFSEARGSLINQLYDTKLVTHRVSADCEINIFLSPSELLHYDVPTAPENIDFPHRYFHPPASNGIDIMLKVPKMTITFPYTATPGEAMKVRWFFWTDWKHMSILGSPLAGEAQYIIPGYATDIIDTYEPIPDGQWAIPNLSPLPSDFNQLCGPEKIRALMRRET
jgi:hypothetical protein